MTVRSSDFDIRRRLALLATASIGGFVAFAGSIWASEGAIGNGPLTGLPHEALALLLALAYYGVQPIVLLTGWLLGRGAGLAIGFVGVEVIGVAAYELNPVATFGDEVGSWTEFGLIFFGFVWVVVIPLVVEVVRSVMRIRRTARSR